METFYFGKLKHLLPSAPKEESAAEHIKNQLRSCNLGLRDTDSDPVRTNQGFAGFGTDCFEISKNLFELLSPACGMSEEEKTAYFQRILSKLKNGKRLTAEEMRFLQAEYPECYPQAARVQAMRDGLESRLKCCRSKEEAQTMFGDAMDSISDDDPMKEFLTAAYQDVMKEFQKSDAYKDLPNTNEEADAQKPKKFKRYETEKEA